MNESRLWLPVKIIGLLHPLISRSVDFTMTGFETILAFIGPERLHRRISEDRAAQDVKLC